MCNTPAKARQCPPQDPRQPPEAPSDPADHRGPADGTPAVSGDPRCAGNDRSRCRSHTQRLRTPGLGAAPTYGLQAANRAPDRLPGQRRGIGLRTAWRATRRTVLSSLPGVGQTDVLATLLAEAPQLIQRRDYKVALRCLCGVAPVTRRSGKHKIVIRRRAAHPRLGLMQSTTGRELRSSTTPSARPSTLPCAPGVTATPVRCARSPTACSPSLAQCWTTRTCYVSGHSTQHHAA